MKRYLLIIGLMMMAVLGKGQTYSTNDPLKIPTEVPTSPEVASFARYGDIPVSEYTGAANISIPLYTVKVGSLSIPVELSYGSSGIQVNQEATWVGLGWNLIAGGAITYRPVGGNDQLFSGYNIPWASRKSLLDYIPSGVGDPSLGGTKNEDYYYGWGCYSTQPTTHSCDDYSMYAGLVGLGEPDIYCANFLNYSFKFFIHPNSGVPVLVGKKNKCLIEKNGYNFKITGEDGTQFWFNSVEQTSNTYRNAWYLSQIYTTDGDSVVFRYKNYGNIEPLPSLNERYGCNFPKGASYENGVGQKRQVNLSPTVGNLYLSSIGSKSEAVYFDVDDRVDVKGAKKLSSVRIVDRSDNREYYRYQFSYDYFTGTEVGGDYITDDRIWTTCTDDAKRKRLKLIKLTKYSVTAPKSSEVYSFDYNETINLPRKTSFSTDYWGYYNGAENSSTWITSGKHTLLPNILDLMLNNVNDDVPGELLQCSGANRGASSTNMDAWMLKAIHYPTGSKTEFKYEPNTFSNLKYPSAENHNALIGSNTYHVLCKEYSPASIKNVSFTLNKSTVIFFNGTINGGSNQYPYTQIKDASILIAGPIGANSQVKTYRLETSDALTFATNNYTKSWIGYFTLEAGTYNFIATIPSSLESTSAPTSNPPLVDATLKFYKINETLLTNYTSIGGGLRIQSITNYDLDNNQISTKTYTYTGGKLLIPLAYLKTKNMVNAAAGISGKEYSLAYLLAGDSYNEIASRNNGNVVGYDKVEEVQINGSTNNGKVVSIFKNNLAKNTVSGYPVFEYDYDNGNLLSKAVLSASNDTINKEKYTYVQGELNREFINYFIEDNYIGPTTDCIANGSDGALSNRQSYIGRYNIIKYSNTASWSYLQSKQTTTYSGSSKLIANSEYKYNLNNYNISEEKIINSDNSVHYTQYTYPLDYSGGVYDLMKTVNMINIPIEQSELVGSTPVQSKLTTYTLFGINNLGYPLLKPSIMSLKTGTNSYEDRIFFKKYDSFGNLTEIENNQSKTVYLWSYRNKLPIAKIDGLTFDEVKAILGETTINDLAKLVQPTKSQIDAIGISFKNSNAFITTFTYKPLVGLVSQTDPAGRTTYYEYDDFGRLKLTKDLAGNILKKYEYHYAGQ